MAGWYKSIAVSSVHKSLRFGDEVTAAYAAAWLVKNFRDMGAMAAWRRVLAFPSEDLGGEGAERVAALFACYQGGRELDNLFMAISYLCRLVRKEPDPELERQPGRLIRTGDELKNAAMWWVHGGRTDIEPPPEAHDVHAGGDFDWYAHVNALSDPSPYRADAMRRDPHAERALREQKELTKRQETPLFDRTEYVDEPMS